MALYGYTYRSAQVSTYNTSNVRNGPVSKPFAPYVPKYGEGPVTNKKIIPVASSGPYDHDDSDDDYECQISPVRGSPSPRKYDDLVMVHNQASRSPPRSHPSQPKPYNNGYAHDYGTNNPVGGANKHDGYGASKPIAGAINHKDNYGPGYDGHGDYNNKQGVKPKPKPETTYGYGGDYNNMQGSKPNFTSNSIYEYGGDYNKEGSKPKPIYGYRGDYNKIEGAKPTCKSIYEYNDDCNNKEGLKPNPSYGYSGDYNNIEGPRPKPKPTGNSIYNNNGYDNYNNVEGPKPTGSSVYGGDYGKYNNKERPKPTGIPVYDNGYGRGSASAARHDNDYGDDGKYHNNKHGGANPTSGWSDSPRKGTQLTKPTNNIDEAIQLLMKEAGVQNGNGRPNKTQHDGPAPPQYDRTMNLANESEGLKNIVTGGGGATQPRHSEPRAANNNGNFNLGQMRQRFNFGGDARRGPECGGVMNHKEAEKKFNGVILDH